MSIFTDLYIKLEYAQPHYNVARIILPYARSAIDFNILEVSHNKRNSLYPHVRGVTNTSNMVHLTIWNKVHQIFFSFILKTNTFHRQSEQLSTRFSNISTSVRRLCDNRVTCSKTLSWRFGATSDPKVKHMMTSSTGWFIRLYT